jgi:hypothetical protein
MSVTLPSQIDFKTIRDEWNRYRLENGSILKLKISLQSLAPNDSNAGGGKATVAMLMAIEPAAEDVGEPSQREPNESDTKTPVKFTPISEITNIYETENRDIFLLIPTLKTVLRTELFSSARSRIYVIVATSEFVPVHFPKTQEVQQVSGPSLEPSPVG